ncbi:MAG TPA: AMP-dependent synthetase/ligase, partial [Mycobacteriales bacterium]|nr:AMP-dependent synthetase/ligase [Mycobacteriales bacterium]
MTEYTVPATIEIPASANLTDAVFRHAAENPDDVCFERKIAGAWQPVTSKDFAEQVRALAAGLVAAGVQPKDRVALLCATRFEWTVLDYAIWTAGGVSVPIYETSSAEQIEWILGDSGAVGLFYESDAHRAAYDEVAPRLPNVAHAWSITSDLDALAASGTAVSEDTIVERRASLTADSLATIIYTSGTTGRPKGCELTHRNFLFDAGTTVAGLDQLFGAAQASTLLFLPLAHVFARIIQVGCVQNRVRMGHTSDIKNLMADFAAFRPTFILSVPRVFEKVYNTAKHKAHADGKGAIFDQAERVAIAFSEGLDTGGAGLATRAQHAVFDKLVYSRLRAALGGRVTYAVSGGAPLGARLGHFFRGIGVTVLEGYGLTETTAGATLNLPDALKVGTVGRPIPGASVRIAEDGEILLRGPNVFLGYYNNAEATREALDSDGWFRTGDIGALDADGFLRITGRKKELIVTAGGKNVAPAVLEDRLRAHPLVSQCLVVGDQRPFIGCLVTIDAEAFPAWKREHGKDAETSIA